MSFSEFYSAIESPDLKVVAQHWNEARGTSPMPGWKDINPKRITAQLGMIWSYSYQAQGDTFSGRVAGNDVARVFGKKFSGTPLSELYPKEMFPMLFVRFKRVLMEPTFFQGSFRHLSTRLTGERIIMPIAEKGGAEGGVFGATAFGRRFGEHSDADFREEVEAWFAP